VATPKGDPKNRMSDEEMIEKFFDLSTVSIDRGDAEKLVEMVTNLDRLEDTRELTHIFVKNVKS
jgi:2-methylcitrate dehydratase PrpD